MRKHKETETVTDDQEFIVIDEGISINKNVYPDPEGIIWGIVFILSGVLLLLSLFNIVSWEVWSYLLRFWPILIVILGFQIMLGSQIFSRIILSVVTFLLFLWVILVSVHAVSPEVFNELPKELLIPVTWWEVIQG